MKILIYKLYNTINNYIYYGSTRGTLQARLSTHIRDAKLPHNSNNKLYIEMKKIGFDKWKIKLIKEINVEDYTQQLKAANKYINVDNPNSLNSINQSKT